MNPRLADRALGALIALVLLAGLLALAAAPTGASSPEAAVPSDARISARRDVGPAVAFLTVRRSELSVAIAYHRSKGWFVAPSPAVPRSVDVSWTATGGDGPVPSLAAAYGHAGGGTVRVTWADGRVDTTGVGTDGLWLVVRRGAVPLSRVDVLGADGSVVSSPAAP
jgi:hypothetical protein